MVLSISRRVSSSTFITIVLHRSDMLPHRRTVARLFRMTAVDYLISSTTTDIFLREMICDSLRL